MSNGSPSTLYSCLSSPNTVSSVASEDLSAFSESEYLTKSLESVLTTLCGQAIKCNLVVNTEAGEKLKMQLRKEFAAGHPPYTEGRIVGRYLTLLNADELAKRAEACQGSVLRSFLKLQVQRLCREILKKLGPDVNYNCDHQDLTAIHEYEPIILEIDPLAEAAKESLKSQENVQPRKIKISIGKRYKVPGPSILRPESVPSFNRVKKVQFPPGDHPSLEEKCRKPNYDDVRFYHIRPRDEEEKSNKEFENLLKSMEVVNGIFKEIVPQIQTQITTPQTSTEVLTTDKQRNKPYNMIEFTSSDYLIKIADVNCRTKSFSIKPRPLVCEICETPQPPSSRPITVLRSSKSYQAISAQVGPSPISYWLTRAKYKYELSMVKPTEVHVVTQAPLVPCHTSPPSYQRRRPSTSDISLTTTEMSSEDSMTTLNILNAQLNKRRMPTGDDQISTYHQPPTHSLKDKQDDFEKDKM